MRRYLNFALVTAAVTLILATWASPHLLLWWFASPVPIPISCNDAVTWSARRMIETQLYAIIGGLIIGLALCFWWNRRAGKKALAAAPSAPVAPPPSTPAAKA